MSPLKKGTSEAEGFLKINLSVSLILKYIYIKVNTTDRQKIDLAKREAI